MTSEIPARTSTRTWSIRTAAAASVLTVALAAGAGAALANLGDSTSGRTGFPAGGGPGGFTPPRGQVLPSPGAHPMPQGVMPGNRSGPRQPQLRPVTRHESSDGLDT